MTSAIDGVRGPTQGRGALALWLGAAVLALSGCATTGEGGKPELDKGGADGYQLQ